MLFVRCTRGKKRAPIGNLAIKEVLGSIPACSTLFLRMIFCSMMTVQLELELIEFGDKEPWLEHHLKGPKNLLQEQNFAEILRS